MTLTTPRSVNVFSGLARKNVHRTNRWERWLTHPAFLSWVVARVAVFGALGLSRYLVSDLGAESPTGRPPSGLLGWDAAWYVRIIRTGYEFLPWEARRFFPLLPALAKPFSFVVSERLATLVIVNGAALVAGIFVERLVTHESGDRAMGARAAWFLALIPPAFVLTMGYAESLMIAGAAGGFLALRRQRWGWAVVAGVAVGLSRPLGLLFVIPAAIEALRGFSEVRTARERAGRLVAIVSPVLGAASYLAYVGIRFGDPLFPFEVQQEIGRRGEFVDPVTRLWRAFGELRAGDTFGSGLHLPWALLFIGLLIVLLRRWPLSYGAFAGVVLFVALSASNLDSLERYGLSAFPLVFVVAQLTRPAWLEKAVLVCCASGLVAYSMLTFLGAYVP